MPDIPKLINSIRSGKYSAKQLRNLLMNANKDEHVSDEDREAVIEEVELALGEHHPKEAKKWLGAFDARPIEVLEEMYARIESQFDLSKNKVKNGVKAGGSMRSGEAVLDWHISYKNNFSEGVVVGAYQWGANDPLKYKVFKYKNANKPGSTYDEKEYLVETPETLAEYERILAEVLVVDT